MSKRFAASLIAAAVLAIVAGSGAAEAAITPTEGTSERSAAPAGPPPAAGSKKLAHVEDLAHRRIGALQGSAHVKYVAQTWPRATLLQYNTPADLVLAVKTGKVDA